ncbi:MAG: hypothetical protein HMLKMBBP_03626 [Planctomycetes bacterium]|nr:hypothetical protein [Planctomycetota bacterium]
MTSADGSSPSAPVPARRVPRFVVPVVGTAALGVAAFFAVPHLLPGSGGEPAEGGAAAAQPSAPASDAPREPAPARPAPSGDARPAAPHGASDGDTVTTSEGGDLSIELRTRHADVPSGAAFTGKIRIANHGTTPVHLPAEGEPRPTLAIVIVDSEGAEVRRVVESGANPFPRRTHAVAPGAVWTLPVTIVAAGDDPLPPGRYSIHAELRADPMWKRLGLPTWTAPKGALRSELVWMTITER